MALALANRLRRLEAIREVATQMMERPQLNRDIFARGLPEPIKSLAKGRRRSDFQWGRWRPRLSLKSAPSPCANAVRASIERAPP